MKKLYFVLLTVLFATISNAQVSSYLFAQTSGAYTENTDAGRVILGSTTSDDQVFNNNTAGQTPPITNTGFPIGFNFTYNGLVYDKFAVNTNGWIVVATGSFQIGASSGSNYTPLSSAGPVGVVNAIAGLARDIQGQTGSEMSYQTLGSSPNRVLVVQWKTFRRFAGSGQDYNFQIRLNETSNTVEVVYGTFTESSATSASPQVGLRGATNADFNNRTGLWASSTAGAVNNASMTLSTAAGGTPVSGLTYTWTPSTAPPANDNCASATPIVCDGSASGSTVFATLDGPATDCSAGSVAPDVWYTIAGTGGNIIASLCGSGYDTKIDVYTGSCGALVCVGGNDNFCGLQSQFSWISVAATTYYIRVHGATGATGGFTLNVTCPPVNDLCVDAIPISCGTTLSGTTVGASTDPSAGTCVTILTTAPGVWYTFVGNGLVTTLSLCGSGYDTKIGVFTGTCAALVCVTGNDDFACPGPAFRSQVTFPTTNAVTYLVLVTGFSTNTGTFNLTMTCAPAIPNDDCTGALPLGCGATVTGTTVGATIDAVPFCITSLNTAPGVWYTFVGNGAANTLTMCVGTAYDSKIGVFTGTCAALVCVTGNDDFCGLQSQVAFPTTLGTTYYVLITGFSTATGAFTLTRTSAPLPNDLCTGAININCGQTITGSTSCGATPDVVPTCVTALSSANGLWYQFVGDGSSVTLSLCGSSYDTKIGVFRGTCAALVCVTGNDDFCGLQSQVTFNTNAGFTYYILVTGFGTATGNFTLTRTCAPACSGVPSPGAITPATSTVCIGSSVTLTCSGYSNNTGLTFQWNQAAAAAGPYAPIAGATSNVYTFTAASTLYYTCTVTCTSAGGGSGTTAPPVVVNVSNIQFTSAAISPTTVCSAGSSVTVTGTVTGGLNLGNYTYTLTGPGTIGAPVVSGPNNSSVSFNVTNIPAGAQVYTLTAMDPVPCSKSTTLNLTVNLTPVVTLVPASATICNGAIQFIRGNVTTGSGTYTYSPLTELFTNSGATIAYTGTVLNSGDTIWAKPTVTRTYTATVTSALNCSSTTPITITVNQLPAITAQPTPTTQTICPGFNVTYTVGATGAGLTYQWRRNGVNLVDGGLINLSSISGATTSSLTISNVGAANAGSYSVVVSGTCPPSVTSNSVTLVIASAPVVPAPSNQSICVPPASPTVALSFATATFSSAATGVPPPGIFQWQVSTNGGGTWTNLANSAPGSSPLYTNVFTNALTIANAPISINGYQYRLVVTNTCGQSTTSAAATLTVNASPVVVATDLFNNRVCLTDTLVPLVGTPVGGAWSGIGVSGFNFVPPVTGIGNFVLSYTYTNAAGCTVRDTTSVKVIDCPERIRRLTDPAALTIYPNPNNGRFNILLKSTLYNYLGMKVYNQVGQLMNGTLVKDPITKRYTLVSPTYSGLAYGRSIPVDLSMLPAGMYLVVIYYDDGVRSEKKGIQVIIQR